MRQVACRACGRPCKGGVCGGCKEAGSLASPEYQANRRARWLRAGRLIQLKAQGFLPPGEELTCCICRQEIFVLGDWSCEHVTPRRDGGTHAPENLGDAHTWCNSAMMPAAPKIRYRRPT